MKIHPIKRGALTTPPKTTPASFFMINLSRCVTTPPSLTTSDLSQHFLHGAVTSLNEPSHDATSCLKCHHTPNLHNGASSPNEPPHYLISLMSMSHCIMLSISLNDPSPIYPSYTHTKIVPPTIQTTAHLHATPDLTKIMFSIFLMSLPP